MNVDGRLRRVFASVLGVDGSALTDDDSTTTIEAWNSVNHIHLILALEAEFGVSFEPVEVAELTSIRALRRRLAGGGE